MPIDDVDDDYYYYSIIFENFNASRKYIWIHYIANITYLYRMISCIRLLLKLS